MAYYVWVGYVCSSDWNFIANNIALTSASISRHLTVVYMHQHKQLYVCWREFKSIKEAHAALQITNSERTKKLLAEKKDRRKRPLGYLNHTSIEYGKYYNELAMKFIQYYEHWVLTCCERILITALNGKSQMSVESHKSIVFHTKISHCTMKAVLLLFVFDRHLWHIISVDLIDLKLRMALNLNPLTVSRSKLLEAT